MNQRCIALAALVLAGPALAACSGSGGTKGHGTSPSMALSPWLSTLTPVISIRS